MQGQFDGSYLSPPGITGDPAPLNEHEDQLEGEGDRWPCRFCGKVLKSAQALGGHQNFHRRERDSLGIKCQKTLLKRRRREESARQAELDAQG